MFNSICIATPHINIKHKRKGASTSSVNYLLCKTAEWPNLLTSWWRSGLGSTDQRSQARSKKNTFQKERLFIISRNWHLLLEEDCNKHNLIKCISRFFLIKSLLLRLNGATVEKHGMDEGCRRIRQF